VAILGKVDEQATMAEQDWDPAVKMAKMGNPEQKVKVVSQALMAV
jgi:hypothetical protein